MATGGLHPLDARFLKLALIQKLLTPAQARQAEERLGRRTRHGEHVTLEQVLQEEGFLTDAECQGLWELIAQATDSQVRQQIERRREDAAGSVAGATTAPVAVEPFPKLAGYEIKELIGRGGMGAVYRARQLTMDRDVALKVLRPELAVNAQYIRRFIREARAAGQLDHGHLVRVYDVSSDERGLYFYMAMEFVEGQTVRQRLRREGRLALPESLRIAAQVASALDCAHRHKIIHRDIKPDNIMLTRKGDAKLCDLGLAKALEGPLEDTDTQTGVTVGTPHYMSPEQAQGGALSPRSDLFSLGATLYHMLTGRPPFEGRSPLEVMTKVSREDPVPADRFDPLLPPPVVGLLARLLAKDPRQRPASAQAVHHELTQLGQDLEAGRVFAYAQAPSGPAGALPPRAPDRRGWAVGAAAAALFLLVCLVARSASRERPAPPPEDPVFVARAGNDSPRPLPSPPPEPAGTREPPDGPRAPEKQTPPAAESPVGRELAPLERQFAEDPGAWPRVLAELDRIADTRGALAQADQDRLHELKAKVEQARSAAAEADWTPRCAAAEALAKAGAFARAAALLADRPAPLRGAKAVSERADAEAARLNARGREDARARADEIRELAGAGLFLVAQRRLADWEDDLENDGTEPDDPRRGLEQEAIRHVQQLLATAGAARAGREAAHRERLGKLEAIRKLSRAHDLSGALTRCDETLARAGPGEQPFYEAERDRLLRAQKLLVTVATAVSAHSGQISEKDFRPRQTIVGHVVRMDERELEVSVAPGGSARVPLSMVTREEMRLLFEQVFRVRKFVAEDRLGLLAYELEDGASAEGRQALPALAAQDPEAAAWLAKLLAVEARSACVQAEELLARAEELWTKARCEDSVRTVAAALEVLGSRSDRSLETRAQALLRLAAEASAAGALLGGEAAPLAHGRVRLDLPARALAGTWRWEGAAAALEADGALAFPAAPARGSPAWALAGTGRLELDLLVPALGTGALSLSAAPEALADAAAPVGARWELTLEAEPGAIQAGLACNGQREPAWALERLAPNAHHRLWLRLEPGQAAWGVDERLVGTRRAGLTAQWRVLLQGHGHVRLHGLRVEGRLIPERTREAWAQEAARALNAALALAVGRRGKALREVLAAYGADLVVASRCGAALALEARAGGRDETARYWASRALFACPEADRPAETAALEDAHRQWQAQRERLGSAPLDPRAGPPLAAVAPEAKAPE